MKNKLRSLTLFFSMLMLVFSGFSSCSTDEAAADDTDGTDDSTLALNVDGNEFVEIAKNEASLFSTGLLLILIASIVGMFLVMKSRPNKNNGPAVIFLKD